MTWQNRDQANTQDFITVMPRDMSSEDEPAVELDVLNEQGEEQEPTPVVLIEVY